VTLERRSPPGMRSFPLLVFAALAVATGPRAAAQSSLGAERRDIDHLRGDVWAAWTAPARFDRREVALSAIEMTAVVATTSRDSTIYAWMTTHPNALVMRLIAPLREGGRFPLNGLGSGQFLLPMSGVAYAAGRLSHNPALRDAGLGCAAAHLASAGLREIIYLSISRARPHDTPSANRITVPGTRAWSDHSFLSGHIANSMACASFLAHRYSVGIGAPMMYAYASAIGLGRMADGWHWASDTMAGATLGFAIGELVANRQLTRMSGGGGNASPSTSRGFRAAWAISF
jgi:membrane-associated phospholipid phosphatase